VSLSEIILLAGTFVLALGVSWMLIAPFFSSHLSPDEVNAAEGGDLQLDRAMLLRRKEMLLEALEDLEQERRSGKIETAEYQTSRAELQQSTAACLAELDALAQRDTTESARAAQKQPPGSAAPSSESEQNPAQEDDGVSSAA
jgi:hypothetical protein